MIYDPTLETLIADQRQVLADLGDAMPKASATPPLPAENWVLPGSHKLTLRIIRPVDTPTAVMLHIHGGGFTVGTPAMSDHSNSELARALGIATVSVDYRLAPQAPHPAALDDCEAASLWLLESSRERFCCERVLIGGESVGATLAALTLLRLRDRHHVADRICGANLVVGCYDFSKTPSQRHSTEALFLSPTRLRATVAAAFPHLSPEALRDPQISPLYAPLNGLPPAILSVGTHDAVLDDSLFMAMRWRAAGNVATLEVYPEGTHSFLRIPSKMAIEGRRRIVKFLRECIGGEYDRK
jgi:acetyl esterase